MGMEYTACALHAAHPNGKPHLNCQGHLESAALIGPSLKKNQAAKGSEPTVSTVNMRTPQMANDGTQWEKKFRVFKNSSFLLRKDSELLQSFAAFEFCGKLTLCCALKSADRTGTEADALEDLKSSTCGSTWKLS